MPPKHTSQNTGFTIVATVSGMLNAQILKTKLEYAGIAVLLDYESAGIIFGITADGLALSEVRILVADQDAEEATLILNTRDEDLASSYPPSGWEEEATSDEPDE